MIATDRRYVLALIRCQRLEAQRAPLLEQIDALRDVREVELVIAAATDFGYLEHLRAVAGGLGCRPRPRRPAA